MRWFRHRCRFWWSLGTFLNCTPVFLGGSMLVVDNFKKIGAHGTTLILQRSIKNITFCLFFKKKSRCWIYRRFGGGSMNWEIFFWLAPPYRPIFFDFLFSEISDTYTRFYGPPKIIKNEHFTWTIWIFENSEDFGTVQIQP